MCFTELGIQHFVDGNVNSFIISDEAGTGSCFVDVPNIKCNCNSTLCHVLFIPNALSI